MEPYGKGETVKLTVPASLEYVRIVRLTASGVASRLGFDVEDIEDLRVAVDELASIVVDHAAGDTVDVTFSVTDDELRIAGSAAVDGGADVTVEGLTSQILAAVTDSYDVGVDDGHVVFRCSRRLPAE